MKQIRLRFRLISLLVAVTGIAVIYGWVANRKNAIARRGRSVAELRTKKAYVYYDYQRGQDFIMEPPEPQWLQKILGRGFFSSVVSVSLGRGAEQEMDVDDTRLLADLISVKRILMTEKFATDTSIAHLKKIRGIRELKVTGGTISDVGVADISCHKSLEELKLPKTSITDSALEIIGSRLRSLRYLNVEGTGVTDEGLQHLSQLRSLKILEIWRTGVTQDGVDRLQKALPELKIYWQH